MSCVAKGYDEALEREQFARNAAYLDLPEMVLGEPLNNLTPHLLAVLTVSKSPFYAGGSFEHTHVAQFLWALHRDYSPRDERGRKKLAERVRKIDLETCQAAISEYMDLQFMDAQRGGKARRPIAADIAELIYRFRWEPWYQTEEQTKHIPIRKLYQELKLYMREHEQTVTNSSDRKIQEWQEKVNRALLNGDITQEQLDEWNAKHRGNN